MVFALHRRRRSLAVLWWSIVTNRLAGRVRGSMLPFFGLYVGIAIVMCVKNALLLAMADGPLLWPAVVGEVVIAVGGVAAVVERGSGDNSGDAGPGPFQGPAAPL